MNQIGNHQQIRNWNDKTHIVVVDSVNTFFGNIDSQPSQVVQILGVQHCSYKKYNKTFY